ncbi:hypothetical protein PoB_004956300 [Plakobranchus ocellatus]|uniref:Uncharacterized protein n=1 Tax=Plakobranchus ocellatus TaxID=259542 RepID=A0AAV4BV29_9GAST|nr:hypothetical protein PoB_004956300 [Plakobranchus ocellatus]
MLELDNPLRQARSTSMEFRSLQSYIFSPEKTINRSTLPQSTSGQPTLHGIGRTSNLTKLRRLNVSLFHHRKIGVVFFPAMRSRSRQPHDLRRLTTVAPSTKDDKWISEMRRLNAELARQKKLQKIVTRII